MAPSIYSVRSVCSPSSAHRRFRGILFLGLALVCWFPSGAWAQTPAAPPRREPRPEFDGPPPFDPDGPRPDRGPGGPGGPGGSQEEVKLVSRFDKDGDHRLNTAERKAAREYIAAPKANYARVVINGQSWGIYVNAQHFDKDFAREWFQTTKGARWKVPGSPRASGGLKYLGTNVADYRKHYEIKSRDDPESWARLIRLCRVLNETPSNRLEAAVQPFLDIDGALKFLALENVFVNNDGYWVRSSDYSLCEDAKGRVHLVPHDANETFSLPGGPGGGPRVTGVALDPLAGADDPDKPLLSKLLAVPSLRARYLGYVRAMAVRWLDWNKLKPLAEAHQSRIADDLKVDTRKLSSMEAFTRGLTEEISEGEGPRGPRRGISLKGFVEQRRTFLLAHPALKAAAGN